MPASWYLPRRRPRPRLGLGPSPSSDLPRTDPTSLPILTDRSGVRPSSSSYHPRPLPALPHRPLGRSCSVRRPRPRRGSDRCARRRPSGHRRRPARGGRARPYHRGLPTRWPGSRVPAPRRGRAEDLRRRPGPVPATWPPRGSRWRPGAGGRRT